jgi:hypothetical protein
VTAPVRAPFMLAAAQIGQSHEIATNLRRIGAQPQRSGPAAPHTDLFQVGTLQAQRLTFGSGQR